LYDDADSETLETFFSKRDYSSTTTNIEIKTIIQRLNSDNRKNILPIVESDFFVEFHLQRFKLLSFLPFKLFQIAHRFIFELEKLKLMNKSEIKHKTVMSDANSKKIFNDEYLTAFCKEISNDRDIYKSTFVQCYDFGIKNFTEFLKSEINENILNLPSDKVNPYLDFVEDKLKKTPYFNTNKSIIDKWITEYDIQDIDFPFLENKEIKKLISMSVNFHHITDEDRILMEEIQIDFYHYAAMIEAVIILDFLKTKRPISEKPIDKKEVDNESETPNQLSVNQAIILLDKLGLFSSTMFENLPNTRKAKLISQLIGKNDKNIKTAIEKLELKPSEITPNYQKDIDKIERILNNLE
jgi:hypothetical protein